MSVRSSRSGNEWCSLRGQECGFYRALGSGGEAASIIVGEKELPKEGHQSIDMLVPVCHHELLMDDAYSNVGAGVAMGAVVREKEIFQLRRPLLCFGANDLRSGAERRLGLVWLPEPCQDKAARRHGGAQG